MDVLLLIENNCQFMNSVYPTQVKEGLVAWQLYLNLCKVCQLLHVC